MQLEKLNTATKYPSIPTYHAIEQGKLRADHLTAPSGEPLLLTEKVDGTNTRIILGGPRDFVIGSRQELLHAAGDLVANAALGIVEAGLTTCQRAAEQRPALYEALALDRERDLIVLYFETYGGRITSASREYGGESATGLRLFDLAIVPDAAARLARHDLATLATMRDQDALQRWANEDELTVAARLLGSALTPRRGLVAELPSTLEDVQALLAEHARTVCPLDGQARGHAEGLVVRTPTRSFIAKVRVEDYRRALRPERARRS